MPEAQLPDPRNKDIQVCIDGTLYHRDDAKISVFDSAVQGGDAVWEGVRVYNGRVFKLDAHLDRMADSAHAMAFEGVPSRDTIKDAIFKTLQANGMYDEAHIRLTLTRGRKVTSGMSPKWNQYGCTLIVLAEWKKPVYSQAGIRLITAAIRRNPPQCVDSKIHHNNLINNILAKIEANAAGVDDAVMLDVDGFLSETNATNIFLVKKGRVFTPFADSCLHGITRATVIDLCQQHQIPVQEKRLTILEMYTADEVFVTGSMGELTPVVEIDGRTIGQQAKGPVTAQLLDLYLQKAKSEGTPIPG